MASSSFDAVSASGGAMTVSMDKEGNVRMRRFNDALDKFLELLEERATASNFQTALPHLNEKLLESARKQFVFHLKDAIKMEKERLAESYSLDDRLAELDSLTREADLRNETAKQHGTTAAALHHDAWRPSIDLSTALSAPVVPLYRERVSDLQAELDAVEAENREAQARLQSTLSEEERRRGDARRALDLLEETVRGLEASEDEHAQLRSMLVLLSGQLGPRGIL